jgi:hypothetical protein
MNAYRFAAIATSFASDAERASQWIRGAATAGAIAASTRSREVFERRLLRRVFGESEACVLRDVVVADARDGGFGRERPIRAQQPGREHRAGAADPAKQWTTTPRPAAISAPMKSRMRGLGDQARLV